MGGLSGKRIAIGGERKFSEIATLVEKRGGVAYPRPVQGQLTPDPEAARLDVETILAAPPDWIVFTTGVGMTMLLEAAEAMGRKDELADCLGRVKLCARGYKTARVLKDMGIEAAVKDEDGTTAGLIEGLSRFELKQSSVVVQYYGDRPETLSQYLDAQGAMVRESYPYRYQPPDQGNLDLLLQEVMNARIDAVMLTSALQARNVFQHARRRGTLEAVANALDGKVLAVAVGKVTAEAVREYGVERCIAPEHERIGSMVVAMEEAFENVFP